MVFLTRVSRNAFKKFYFNLQGYNKFGLLHDDILHETDVVKEALRRLPQNVVDERNFRILRAYQCDIRREFLPKEDWTKLEDDVKYLRPVIEEVETEIKEKKEWFKKH